MKILKLFIYKKEKRTDNPVVPEILQKEVAADNPTSSVNKEEDDEINIYYLPQKIIEAIKVSIKDFAADHRLNLEHEPNKSEHKKIFDIVNSLITRENVVKFFRTIFETEEDPVFVIDFIDFSKEIFLERKNTSFLIEKIIIFKKNGCMCGVEIVSKSQKKQQSP